MKRVYLTGLESSGQKWLKKCLNQHPELTVSGQSAPCFWRNERRYDWPNPSNEWFVIITRDKTCHTRSVAKLGYNDGHEGEFSDDENMAHILNCASSFPRDRVLWVSYEALMCYREAYFEWIFQQFGVEYHHVQTEYKDGNPKYMSRA
jgi:hypothetical protein